MNSLEARGLAKEFVGGDGSAIRVLSGLDFSVAPGEFVAIIGASGSGKSTLLHLLGALDTPDRGEIRLDGQAYADLAPDALSALRNTALPLWMYVLTSAPPMSPSRAFRSFIDSRFLPPMLIPRNNAM